MQSYHFLKRKRGENESDTEMSSSPPFKKQRMNDMILSEIEDKEQRLERMNELLVRMKTIEKYYDDSTAPIYDSANTVILNITSFLNLGVMSRNEWLAHIGNVSVSELLIFYRRSHGVIYKKAYHWLEKLRLSQSMYKTPQRIQNEKDFPNGFPVQNISNNNNKENVSNNNNNNNMMNARCYRCNEYGHFIRDCPAILPLNPLYNKFRPSSIYKQFGDICKICKKSGHWKSECPLLYKYKYKKPEIKNAYNLFKTNEDEMNKHCCYICGDSRHLTENCKEAESLFNSQNSFSSQIDIGRNDVNQHNEDNGKEKEKENKSDVGPSIDLLIKYGNKCQNCGGFGHWKKDCKSNKKNTCFNCYEEGHWASNCPKKKSY